MWSYISGCYLGQRKQRVQRRFWHWNQARCIAVLCEQVQGYVVLSQLKRLLRRAKATLVKRKR